jgi:hypothetical protein
MNKIIVPLRIGVKCAAVDYLRNALRESLNRSLLIAIDDGACHELLDALVRENAQKSYGDATAKLISLFQENHRPEPTGEVDEATTRNDHTVRLATQSRTR